MRLFKRALSLLVVLALVFCGTAVFADETGGASSSGSGGAGAGSSSGTTVPVVPASVSLSLDKSSAVEGDAVLLTVTISGLTKNLKSADITYAVDSDAVTPNGVTEVEETQYHYLAQYTAETPASEDIAIEIPMTAAFGIADLPKTVEISLVSAELVSDELLEEVPVTIESTLGAAVTLEVKGIATAAKLVFADKIFKTDDFAVGFKPAEGEEIVATLKLDKTGTVIYASTDAPLAPATYTVTVTAPGYKINSTGVTFEITAEKTAPEFEIKLNAGDMDGNGTIDLFDFHKLCIELTDKTGTAGFDLNRDGTVGTSDVTMLVANWTKFLAKEDNTDE